ncbi:MAG: PD40 domain-containing protein [Deltaproteobacteria bacterium]|nr:PD40 domain-containing protein [Deltaproteobacteria bacterium]
MRILLPLVSVFFAIFALGNGSRAQIRDPDLDWYTITTPNFQIHYHDPLKSAAQQLAIVAERANSAIQKSLGFSIDDQVQMVLSDSSDAAQGLAQVVPRNVIQIYATSPDDLSALADYDEWLTQIVIHEHTHILHLNQIGGIPAVINTLLGKTYAPNKAQPLWFTEGLAVYQESRQTSGGRLRSSMFDMFLRMDALENRLLSIDQVSNIANRWPHGTIPYLYGSRFVEYIARKYGDRVLTQIGFDYGRQTLPYGLNRVTLRATGRSFVALYLGFLGELRQKYSHEKALIEKAGLLEGKELTRHGEVSRAPMYLPDGRLIYYASDERSHAQIRTVGGDEIVRCNGKATPAPHPNGRELYFDMTAPYRDRYYFNDLFRYDFETEETARLTWGLRAREPNISPDGSSIAFVFQKSGTSHLAVARLTDIGRTQRVLVLSKPFEQIYTPRWSPDGRTIAFSVWRQGGYRDIALVEVDTGRIFDITYDRAFDTGPTWSPDGKWLYFSSDRSGVANIYALCMHSGRTYMVTNVIGGAFQPVISPSGSYLIYVGYKSRGFDLYRLTLDERRFRPAQPYRSNRPRTVTLPQGARLPYRPYNPIGTLWPDNYRLDIRPDDFGYQLQIGVSGSDVLGFHAYNVNSGVSFERGELVCDADYSYLRWLITPTLRLFRSIGKRYDLEIAGESQSWVESVVGGSLGLSYSFPGDFYTESLGISYSLFDVRRIEPFRTALDPNLPPPSIPQTGTVPNIRVSWRFSNTERQAYDITTSEGQSLSLSLAITDPLLGAQYQSISFRWSFRQFFSLPWVDHHVLALSYTGGESAGDRGQRPVFSIGGFPSISLLDTSIYELIFTGTIPALDGEALRGYKTNDRLGLHFHLVQAEYRFPVWRSDVGFETLPFYLKQLYALVFADYGDAYRDLFDISNFRLGIGSELLTRIVIGYHLLLTVRLGLARGLSEGGETQFYFHLGAPF